MLTKGRELAKKTNTDLTAVLLGHNVKAHAKRLTDNAKKVLVVDDAKLENFNSEPYQLVLSQLITQRKPVLTLMAHTSFGVDLAPSLATQLDIPLATDCIDVELEGQTLGVVRQVYGGKVNVRARLRESEQYLVTIRPATFEAKEVEPLGGEILEIESPLREDTKYKRFVEYVQPPAGDVDISTADVIVGVGRGIKDEENMPMVKALAEELGGVLGCSRPIVDKEWLPKDRQVGTSGKTVKPKLYIAVGVSGAFQHVTGMKNSDLIIAINRDPKAPIFRVSDYGVVDDLFKVVPVLTSKLQEAKQGKN
jgi:electron transfer flavoprotein alpha subunit